MNKTPDEIKKGLEFASINCRGAQDCEKTCAYYKECSNFDYETTEIPCTMLFDALAYIQQLEAANAELLTKVEQLESTISQVSKALCGKENATAEEIIAAFSQVKRERDAAVADIEESEPCFACKHFKRNAGNCGGGKKCLRLAEIAERNGGTYKGKFFEWRGVKEE